MRMMTGAILILANAVMLMALPFWGAETGGGAPAWQMQLMAIYAWALLGIGVAFLAWGLVKDLRHRRPYGKSFPTEKQMSEH
ncbi:MAG: hypothetical protein HZA50_16805 [Planctomycetes bacterium]|nr:hypothetical protein [Planctomycetota bacterium]